MAIQDDFKNALASWASGVTVVATRSDGRWYGVTASSFTSLSFDPPLVLVCVNNSNRLTRMLEQSRRLAVSILARDQEGVSGENARSGREPLEEIDPEIAQLTANGMPVFRNSAAWLDCELHDLIVRGDHTIVIGKVVEAQSDAGKMPLVYYRRAYRSIAT